MGLIRRYEIATARRLQCRERADRWMQSAGSYLFLIGDQSPVPRNSILLRAARFELSISRRAPRSSESFRPPDFAFSRVQARLAAIIAFGERDAASSRPRKVVSIVVVESRDVSTRRIIETANGKTPRRIASRVRARAPVCKWQTHRSEEAPLPLLPPTCPRHLGENCRPLSSSSATLQVADDTPRYSRTGRAPCRGA